jgi:plastocyanin
MSWRILFAAALLTLTLGCDRSTQPLTASTAPSPAASGSLTILIVTGGSFVTAGLPSSSVTVVRGSTITFVNNDTTPHMLPIAGTVRPTFLDPGAQTSVTLLDAGTFTFCCALQSGRTITIVVV